MQQPTSNGELALRYVAATAATLLAIAGAQLQVPNSFAWTLAIITLLGVPVSLWLRLNQMRVGGLTVPRPLLNSATVIGSFGAAFYFVFLPMRDFFGPILSGNTSPDFWMSFGGGEPVTALMKLFLLFAAFRSFALISDKDATLTTVPSFSVLLLLIPIHRGLEVVVYFVAWTFVAATLLALDHRSEVREAVSATLPALVAGQDVRLGARSLATILGFSLVAATGISLYLSSRDADERSATESAVTSLATRLTNFALALPENSSGSGPERQIDFKSGPSLPTRAHLWTVEASTFGRKPIFPSYWRMFSLSHYNGESWTQRELSSKGVPFQQLDDELWPWRRLRGLVNTSGDPRGREGGFRDQGERRFGGENAPRISRLRDDDPRVFGPGNSQMLRRVPLRLPGYNVASKLPVVQRQFTHDGFLVRQRVTSLVPNIGFLPVQPSVRAITILDDPPKEIRGRSDGAIDMGIIKIAQSLVVLSDVPPLAEYGIKGKSLPTRRMSAAQIKRSGIYLTPAERADFLQLPATLPARVRRLSASFVERMPAYASNYAKASRLALNLQQDAVYTLRPPAVPDGRDATDYFLFEGNKRGYCTYFAGALTVLCRAQGIPARVVSGFAGMQANKAGASIIREGNAHAWTEIWVEGFGWAIVDATPADDRGDNSPTWIQNWADWTSSTLLQVATGFNQQRIPLGLVVFGLILLWAMRRASHFKSRFSQDRSSAQREDDSERRTVVLAYSRAARLMARKFRAKTPWETPDEWLQSCIDKLSPSDAEALRRLTALYMAARYGTRPLPNGSGKLATTTAADVGWTRVKTG